MNRYVLSRAFWLLGGKEVRGEKPREESGQLVYKPVGHTWKGAEGRVRSQKSPGPVPRTPEIEAEGRRRESW